MNVSDAVDILWESVQRGVHDPDELKGRLSMDDAYAVQLGVLGRHEESGDRLVGWKVGLTAKAIQAQLGFHEPVLGFLTERARYESGSNLDFDSLIAPGFENELCLTIGQTLTGPNVTFDQANQAISRVAPALEIIEKRSRPPLDMSLAMADNGQQKGFIVGDSIPFGGMDLAAVTVDVHLNGTKEETATGAEVLGTPVESVLWLANKLSQFDRSLEAGSVVMSGSFTKQYDLSRGDSIEANFSGIGRVTAMFP